MLVTVPARSGALCLETQASFAGLALACSYADSDEFEAEVVRARREAGAYGAPRGQRAIVLGLVAAAAALLLAALV